MSSTIRGQLKVLQDYEMDLEVCTPVYSRFYSEWRAKSPPERGNGKG